MNKFNAIFGIIWEAFTMICVIIVIVGATGLLTLDAIANNVTDSSRSLDPRYVQYLEDDGRVSIEEVLTIMVENHMEKES